MISTADYPRLISMPHRVHWCGFVATTRDLQRDGWQISADQDMSALAVRLVMKHEDHQMFAVTNLVDICRWSEMHAAAAMGRGWIADDPRNDWRFLDFHVVRMAPQIMVQYYEEFGAPFLNTRPIDAYTQMKCGRIDSIEDLVPFASPLVQTKELIVAPDKVSSILAQLVEAQIPEQERIRARQRLRESREGLELGAEPRRAFHAQIMSIAA